MFQHFLSTKYWRCGRSRLLWGKEPSNCLERCQTSSRHRHENGGLGSEKNDMGLRKKTKLLRAKMGECFSKIIDVWEASPLPCHVMKIKPGGLAQTKSPKNVVKELQKETFGPEGTRGELHCHAGWLCLCSTPKGCCRHLMCLDSPERGR